MENVYGHTRVLRFLLDDEMIGIYVHACCAVAFNWTRSRQVLNVCSGECPMLVGVFLGGRGGYYVKYYVLFSCAFIICLVI